MPDELLFTVVGSTAELADPISLADAGLRERADLQEWVLAHPAMLGPDVMIVTFEFDRWWTPNGAAPADRLDVLGLGSDGRLVVAELKRDKAPDTTEMQAIKYAAMASRFTVETLAEQHARFLSRRDQPISNDDALAALTAHAPEISAETLRQPRIVLLARDYPPVLTATTVWLTERGLDITLMKFEAYRASVPTRDGGSAHTQVLVSVSQLYPVRDVEEFTVAPAKAEVRATAEKRRTQDVSTVRRLIDADAVVDGTQFRLALGPRAGIGAEARAEVEAWLAGDPLRRKASWQNKPSAPLIWQADGQEYSPSGLVRKIIRDVTAIDGSYHGTLLWVDDDGRTIVDLAKALNSREGV